jgi:hypothetical protein
MVFMYLKCVSRDVLPFIALWWECASESLKTSSDAGAKASVIYIFCQIEILHATPAHMCERLWYTFRRIASSIGVCEVADSAMVEAERNSELETARR